MKLALLSQIRQRVEAQPEAPALEIENHTLPYGELWQLAERYAKALKHLLLDDQKKAATPIAALHFKKSNEFVVAQLACWLADIAFLPLDIHWPEQRKQRAIQSTSCTLLLFSGASKPVACSTEPLVYHKLDESSLCCCKVNQRPADLSIDKEKLNDGEHQPLAYIIFTSGSSGEPKGVALPFSGLLNTFREQISATQLQPRGRTLWLHHVCFDASIADIWVTLLAGATLVAANNLTPDAILTFIRSSQITYVDLPAALLPLLAPSDIPKQLQTLLVGGEAVDRNVLNTWHQHLRVVIAYGPSEASICSSMHLWQGNELHSGLLGKPIQGINYHVVDTEGETIEHEGVGELVITGQGLALGYFNASTADEARFTYLNKQRAYKTGDWVEKSASNYIFKGRVDRQFKLHGKLICPEEIEQVVVKNPKVKEAYAIANKKQAENNYWLCIVGEISRSALFDWMKKDLPLWVCQPKCVFFEALPRNTNGKVDQSYLKYQCEQQTINNEESQESIDATFLSQLQKHAGKHVHKETRVAQLAIDSIQWLRILLALRDQGLTVDTTTFYTKIREAKTSIEDIEKTLSNKPPHTFTEKKSTELAQFLSVYPELNIAEEKNTTLSNSILITGASGHLGGLLLTQLLNKNRQIFCLLRKGSSSLEPFKQKFNQVIQQGRLQLILGDIAKPQFGLAKKQWHSLSSTIGDVYHCAADTNVLKPVEELMATNVTGTYHVLQFCAATGYKPLHYASSLALVVDSSWKTTIVDENNHLATGSFYGGYAQSKWLAEQLVQAYPHSNIFRFGLLVGSPEKPSRKDLFNLHFLHQASIYAEENASVDFTPSEQAAELMYLISLHSIAGIYHIHNPKAVKAKQVNEILKTLGVELEEKPKEVGSDPHRIYKMTGTKIQSDITAQYLKDLNASMPSASRDFIENYIKALVP